MAYEMSAEQPTVNRQRSTVARLLSFVFYAGAALLVTLLLLRFGMRALGVRPDIAFPGLVYSLTAPLVQPFYRFFPLPTPYGERFDIAIVETASLAAAGAVLVVALVVMVVCLLLFRRDGPYSSGRDERV